MGTTDIINEIKDRNKQKESNLSCHIERDSLIEKTKARENERACEVKRERDRCGYK